MARAFPENLLGFQRLFPTEAACAEYLERLRWPEGFDCPACHAREAPYRFGSRPTVLRCRHCKRDTSLTAGTVMHRTRTPLQVWFWAAYLVTSETPGRSAVQLQRQLGLARYETAFQILHKLRAAMVRPKRDRIGGDWVVEADEANVGGQTKGEGRGVHDKEVVVGAVEVRRGKPPAKLRGSLTSGRARRGGLYAGRLRLRHIPSRAASHLEQFVRESVEPGTMIVTDGWQGYGGLKKLGYDHQSATLGGDPEIADAVLPLIHLVFSNLKTWLQGTHHGVSDRHLQAYLNEYVFRFNRRFYPMSMFNGVLGIAARRRGPTYDQLYAGRWAHPKM